MKDLQLSKKNRPPQNMKFLHYFSLFVSHFCLLDSDPHSKAVKRNPYPKHCQIPYLFSNVQCVPSSSFTLPYSFLYHSLCLLLPFAFLFIQFAVSFYLLSFSLFSLDFIHIFHTLFPFSIPSALFLNSTYVKFLPFFRFCHSLSLNLFHSF
jgi:hypothetical protein